MASRWRLLPGLRHQAARLGHAYVSPVAPRPSGCQAKRRAEWPKGWSPGFSPALIARLFLALAVTFRPDGAELAVATLNSQITFWDPENAVQTGSIEGRHDLKTGRKELDKITAKHSAKGK